MYLIRVVNDGPWLFNNQLIVLQRWCKGFKLNQLDFSSSPFWIQLRDLPLENMSVEVGKKLMVAFGDVQEAVIAQLNGNQGRCIRVKVELDITKPLPRGRRVMATGGELVWVTFKYEKLPIYCQYCGIVGNDDRGCIEKYNDTEKGLACKNQYGAWLKASPIKALARQRAEGRPEYASPTASSSEETDLERSMYRGEDNRNPGKLGVFENGSKRIVWGSVQKGNFRSGADIMGSNDDARVAGPK